MLDGDLRKPCLHERFGIRQSPGLCEVLRGEASVFDVMQKTSVPGLMIITAGYWTPETGEALLTANLDQLFALFRSQFDFVLVDSSPALPIADALILARHTDGVILSFMQGVSRMQQATQTCDRFSAVGVRVLGAFVSGTVHETYSASEKYYRSSANRDSAPIAAEMS